MKRKTAVQAVRTGDGRVIIQRGGARILLSKVAGMVLLLACLANQPLWAAQGWMITGMDMLGLMFLFAGVAGRLTCTMFLGGYKIRSLVVVGPYSMCRNPLYFFSMLGFTGLGLATHSWIIVAALLFLFAVYYPTVIRGEEEFLGQIYGTEFQAYCQSTPRFWPKWRGRVWPEQYLAHPRLFLKALRDASGFLVAYLALQLIGKLHAGQVLPFWWSLW